jgi:4-amino-4-deoxy-L-arabinose transferase-like glycosyltransferase
MKSATISRRPVARNKTLRDAEKILPQPGRMDPTWRRCALVLFLLLAAVSLLYCTLPLSSVIKIGEDEDFALSKALLLLKGYKMYTDFWNDQPPLHTFLLKTIFAHVSFSVLAARLFTVASTLLLLSALFLLVLRLNGLLTATLATLLLVGSPGFLELSSSAMVELPGLAPVLVALCLVQTGPETRGRLGEILAGLAFAVALQIKLIGALYLPLVALVLWMRHRQSPRQLRAWIISGLSFACALAIGFAGIHVLTGDDWTAQFAQSRASHFSSVQSQEYGSPADFPFRWDVLLKHWDTTVPALLGCFLIVRRHSIEKWALPCSWLVLTLVVFSRYRPWWNYYYVHTAIPLCWLGAVGIVAVWQHTRNLKRVSVYAAATACGLCAVSWFAGRLYLQAAEIRSKPRTYASPVLNEIKRYRPFASFIWASEPVYAFHADMVIPPGIATLSLKRFWTGDMTNAELVRRMRALHPEIVLLTITEGKQAPFQSVLDMDYRMVYQDPEHRLYVLPAVVQKADPWPGG